MTLFSYEIFDAVARQGSFNKAAQQLHLTPSAISHAIAVMEAELGFTLFNRGKNGVTMTSYGASLYPSIRAVLNSDEALQQSIARLNGLEKGKVKLGAFNSVCAGLLPQILKSFMASYPQIEVEVYQGTYDDVKEWLRTGQVDLAFLSATCREEFNLTELFREPLLCIVPQDWPEPPNGIMTPELMNGQSFVVQCDATDAEMRQFLKKYSISTERRCHVIDDQSNIAMVEAGLGISIMPRMLLRSCTAAVKIYPIEPEEYREPLLCIVPQDWPEPPNGIMTPELMNGQSFVVQCDATDAEMRQFLKKYSISTERRCHVIDDQSNIAMVEAGLGISIMPRMLLRSCTAAVKIYPIEPEEYRVVGLAVQRPTAMAPAVEQMFRHIVDFCRQMDPQLL